MHYTISVCCVCSVPARSWFFHYCFDFLQYETYILNQPYISYLQLLWPFLMWVLDAADLRGSECVSMLLDVLSTSVHKQNNKRLLKTTLLSLSFVIWHYFNQKSPLTGSIFALFISGSIMYFKQWVHKAWWVATRKLVLCIKQISLPLCNTGSVNHRSFNI